MFNWNVLYVFINNANDIFCFFYGMSNFISVWNMLQGNKSCVLPQMLRTLHLICWPATVVVLIDNCVPCIYSICLVCLGCHSFLLAAATLLSLLVCVSASSLHFWKSLPESCLVTWISSYATDRPLESCRVRCCHPSSSTRTPQTCVTTLKLVTSRRTRFRVETCSHPHPIMAVSTLPLWDVSNKDNKEEYRSLVRNCVVWCHRNGLQVNTSKTKELVIDSGGTEAVQDQFW